MPSPPTGIRRWIRAALLLFVGLFLVIAGIGAGSIFPNLAVRIIIGAMAILVGVRFFWNGLQLLSGMVTEQPTATITTPATLSPPPIDNRPDWPQLLSAHRSMLEQALTPARRMAVLAIWSRGIDEQAHALSDLIAAQDKPDPFIEAQVEAMMLAYQIGLLAGRKLGDATFARAEAGRIGRMLRDRWRALGLPVENAGSNVGVVVDRVLLQIVDAGIHDATSSPEPEARHNE